MKRLKFFSFVVLLGMLAFLATPNVQIAQAAPPSNDNFADAIVIGSLPYSSK